MATRTIYSTRSAHLTFCTRRGWIECGNQSSWFWYAGSWRTTLETGIVQLRLFGLTLTLVL